MDELDDEDLFYAWRICLGTTERQSKIIKELNALTKIIKELNALTKEERKEKYKKEHNQAIEVLLKRLDLFREERNDEAATICKEYARCHTESNRRKGETK